MDLEEQERFSVVKKRRTRRSVETRRLLGMFMFTSIYSHITSCPNLFRGATGPRSFIEMTIMLISEV